jgi:hypothetical protein
MYKFVLLTLVMMAGVALTSCAGIHSGTNLGKVAKDSGMVNVTTGDGTFENYKATGHYKVTEIGIAAGIPWLFKFCELYPSGVTNEALLGQIADRANADGADAMINVTPHEEWYSGFPFFIVGLYVDHAEGTGINLK